METRANYLMVGSFVLVFSFGLIGFVIWLAKFQFDQDWKRYDIFFDGSVTGLRDGSAVRYSGVKVGEVIFIGLDRENPSRVRTLIEVEDNTPVQVDTVASLGLEGLTGGRFILLSGGKLDAPPLEAKPGQKRPVIRSKPSAIEEVLQSAPELLASANEILGPENQEHIKKILTDIAAISSAIASQSGEIEKLIRDAADAMANLRTTTQALEDMAGTLEQDIGSLVKKAEAAMGSIEDLANTVDHSVLDTREDVKGLITDLRGSAQSFTAMAEEFKDLAEENRAPLRDFTHTGLYDLTSLLIEARGLLSELSRVTTEVERDPARFLFGNQQQGYEANQ